MSGSAHSLAQYTLLHFIADLPNALGNEVSSRRKKNYKQTFFRLQGSHLLRIKYKACQRILASCLHIQAVSIYSAFSLGVRELLPLLKLDVCVEKFTTLITSRSFFFPMNGEFFFLEIQSKGLCLRSGN